LRFLLQEFDLPRGITIIGRSLDCHLTIEDPLVSRQHARIVIDDGGACVEDMGSRNGVKVNGGTIRGSTPLQDGDRVRIGTQDFVFCRVDPAGRAHSKTTGVLRLCANCRLPYPREMVACPNCEATEQTDDDTLSGTGSLEGRNAWNVQLLVEALERALTLGRVSDAERIVRRASAQVEELVTAGASVDPKGLAALGVQAAATTLASNDPTWALWVVDVYRRTGRVPPVAVTERLAEVASKHRSLLHGALGDLVAQLGTTARTASENEVDALARLEQLRRQLDTGTSMPPATPVANGPASGPHRADRADPSASATEITGEWPRPERV
jgi:hypothetical protein